MKAIAANPSDNFSEAAAAHAKVNAAIDALRAEYDATSKKIDATAAELERQQNLRLPPDEMKRAVIEMLSANAKRFERTLRAAVCDFVRHKHGGGTVPIEARASGRPMTYADIEAIIAGDFGDYGFTNLLRANETPHVFDAPMFMFFQSVITERLEAILAGVSAEEMGYGKIVGNEVGCGLDERRALVAKLKADLDLLVHCRADLATKLAALGYRVPSKPNRLD